MKLETLFFTRSLEEAFRRAPDGAWVDSRPPSKEFPRKGELFIVFLKKEKKSK